MSLTRRKINLQPAISISAAAFTAASGTLHGDLKYLGDQGIKKALIGLHCTTHSNTNANETYQVYITSGMFMPDGTKMYWDLGAFILISGADAVVGDIMVLGEGANAPTSVVANGTLTGIAPTLANGTDLDTRGSITTAIVREGFFGDWLSYTIVGAGTTPGPITFQIGALVWS